MKLNTKRDKEGLYKGIFMAYFILFVHFILIAGIGCLVIFFRGVIEYMLWIFVGCSALIAISGYRFYQKMKYEGKSLNEMLNSQVFKGRAVEIEFLGGVATLRMGKSGEALPPPEEFQHFPRQIEAPLEVSSESRMAEDLHNLAKLLEDDLITREEFDRAKEDIFNKKDVSDA